MGLKLALSIKLQAMTTHRESLLAIGLRWRWVVSFTLWTLRQLVFFFLVSWGGVRLSPLGTSANIWPIVPAPDDECGVVGGMRIGRGNRSTRRKPAPVPLCPPQIPHDLTLDRTRAAAVGSRQLTAWAMAWPSSIKSPLFLFTISFRIGYSSDLLLI
jgi:hypothetical protein